MAKNEKLNDYIQGLKYNPDLVLAFNGTEYSSYPLFESKYDGDKFLVIKNDRIPVSNAGYDIAVGASNNHNTYPGALLMADQNLINNQPNLIMAKRAPIGLTFDLPGEFTSKISVDKPSYSSVSDAINAKVTEWIETSEGRDIPSNFSFLESQVYSKEHLKMTVGFDLNEKLNLNFTAVKDKKKRIYILSFKQIFYTVSVDDNNIEAGDFFDEEESKEEFSKKVNENNPPVYVSSVSYGRVIYIALETSNMDEKFENTIKSAFLNIKANEKLIQDSILNECTFSAVVIGGGAAKHIDLITDYKKVKDIITSNATLTADNPVVPISYSTCFLKDNRQAIINSVTQYVQTTRETYNKGLVIFEHRGGYVAKCEVTWQERKEGSGDTIQTEPKGWINNGHKFTAPFSTTIQIPACATNLHVKIEEATGLVWEPWRVVVNQNFAVLPELRIKISGTTLSPSKEITGDKA